MGHMLNNTIQDVLVRRARMLGKNACWVPGTDHASIATEAKVVKMLSEKGINKSDLTREEFLVHAWDWKEKYGGIILEQLKKLGASCDWDRTRFTMEKSLYNAVVDVFVDLYNKGLIYRGTKMVNWDPAGKTTLSDEEVEFRQVQDYLYYVKYMFEDGSGYLEVATARPETIAGDVAVCVNPEDPRYKSLLGKKVIVPLINRAVDIISDPYIDIEFGTGVLKVTPAHDIHDYEIGLKNNLPVYDTLNEDGTISEKGLLFVGMDRFEARKEWIKSLEEAELLIKTEPYTHNVGFSERTHVVVEPRISTQWFVDMQGFMKRNPEILSSVMDGEIQFWPSKFKNTYNHWITNIKDWNISRQLWWGQRIPAWYAPNGSYKVARNVDEAVLLFNNDGISVTKEDLKQDEDVLDTWFSSWLWPISVFDGFENPDNKDIQYYYPTNDLVTAPEILFFWVARMIMAGYEYKNEKPFRNVYFTGIVRDKQRRKMSKSLGNSPDPLDLISKYGADAVRMGMLLCSPAGNDILFDESQIEQGRNFCNKIWNAFRLVNGWQLNDEQEQRSNEKQANLWFESKFNNSAMEIGELFDQFRLNEALMSIYKLIWDDFCSVYLEAVKPPYGSGISAATQSQVKQHFENVLLLLHPFMPFITEELYHALHNGKPENACMNGIYPGHNRELNETGSATLSVVTEIRNIRNSKNIPLKTPLKVNIRTLNEDFILYKEFIEKLTNTEIVFNNEPESGYVSALAGTAEILVYISENIDIQSEKSRIGEELSYLKGFLKSVDAKLSNEKFVANANSEIVERERQKKSDTEQKIEHLEKQLQNL